MSRLPRTLALALVLLVGGCAALRPSPPPERDAQLRLAQGLHALRAGDYAEAYERLAWVMAHCPGREAGIKAQVAVAALELDPRHAGGRPELGLEILGDLILDPHAHDWLRPLTRTTYLLALGLGAGEMAPPATAAEDDTDPEDPAEAPDPAKDPDDLVDPTEPPEPPDPEEAAAPDELVETPRDTVPPAAEPRDTMRPDTTIPFAAGPIYGCGQPVQVRIAADAELPSLPGPSLAAMLGAAEAERDAEAARAATLLTELNAARRELTETRAELERIRRTLRP
jgi:hypothetical protein